VTDFDLSDNTKMTINKKVSPVEISAEFESLGLRHDNVVSSEPSPLIRPPPRLEL
jgi:hypothetical protein